MNRKICGVVAAVLTLAAIAGLSGCKTEDDPKTASSESIIGVSGLDKPAAELESDNEPIDEPSDVYTPEVEATPQSSFETPGTYEDAEKEEFFRICNDLEFENDVFIKRLKAIGVVVFDNSTYMRLMEETFSDIFGLQGDMAAEVTLSDYQLEKYGQLIRLLYARVNERRKSPYLDYDEEVRQYQIGAFGEDPSYSNIDAILNLSRLKANIVYTGGISNEKRTELFQKIDSIITYCAGKIYEGSDLDSTYTIDSIKALSNIVSVDYDDRTVYDFDSVSLFRGEVYRKPSVLFLLDEIGYSSEFAVDAVIESGSKDYAQWFVYDLLFEVPVNVFKSDTEGNLVP